MASSPAGGLDFGCCSNSAFVYVSLQPKRSAEQKQMERARARESRSRKVCRVERSVPSVSGDRS
jgi:hypothetical protein